METWRVVTGDCVEQMAAMDECSVDSVVCDPPYLIGFMGKEFDSQHKTFVERKSNQRAGSFEAEHGNHNPTDSADQARTRLAEGRRAQVWHEAWAREALRVLKPGGHLLAFGGTRTYHRLACAVEDAGFEIRDTICWLYGSGFPKSLNVGKAIDKAARGVPQGGADPTSTNHGRFKGGCSDESPEGRGFGAGPGAFMAEEGDSDPVDADALVVEAQPWVGFGTALKPAHEPVVVARKPLSGTVAQTVLEHGTGALNVDGCRIEGDKGDGNWKGKGPNDPGFMGGWRSVETDENPSGRWPANVVLDDEAARMLDEQTGETVSRFAPRGSGMGYHGGDGDDQTGRGHDDSGGASRFFYVAKASRAERNAGLEGFEKKPLLWSSGEQSPGTFQAEGTERAARNPHPTVKPVELMRWLVRLVTPPGGVVLDPFTGSGTTGCAAVLEGFDFVGIEREPEYAKIAEARIGWWERHRGDGEADRVLAAGRERDRVEETGQGSLFEAAS